MQPELIHHHTCSFEGFSSTGHGFQLPEFLSRTSLRHVITFRRLLVDWRDGLLASTPLPPSMPHPPHFAASPLPSASGLC